MLREIISNEWYTILIVLSLCVLTLAKQVYANRFREFLGVVGNSKYLKIYSREKKLFDKFDSLLFLNLIISLSIFSLLCYTTLIDPLLFDIILLVKIALGIGIVLLVKSFLDRIIASLFEINTIIDAYIFQKTSYKNFIGILLLPINVFLVFVIPPNPAIFYVILGVLILINLIGLITSIKSHQKIIIHNFFYFILYLCALEIGPYIILYKLLKDS